MDKNLAAFTSSDAIYPEYVSINEIEHGKVTITVRGKQKANGDCGDVVMATLTASEFCQLIGSLVLKKVT